MCLLQQCFVQRMTESVFLNLLKQKNWLLKDDVNLYKTNLNSGKPKWRKDDRNKQVYTIEIEMRRTFNYHLNINKYFYNSLKNELTFFGIKTKY